MFRISTSEDMNTRGTLVKGLRVEDVKALDVFEGTVCLLTAGLDPCAEGRLQQYSKKRLLVQSLTHPAKITDLPTALSRPNDREPMDNPEAEKYVKLLKKGNVAERDPANRAEPVEDGVKVGIVEAWVYVWEDELEGLDPEIWK